MKNIAIITGATGGLGKSFMKHLVGNVDEVWAIGRNIDKLKSLKKSHGDKIKVFSIDLSDINNLDYIRNELSNKEYVVKYLINNAGTGRMAPSTDFTDLDIQSHIHTHNTALALLCNICIPYMKKGCHIVNMASQSAFQPVAYINLYAACKAFCYSYSRALNMELKDRGIVVTVACPGWVKTELLQTEMNGHKIKFPHLADPEEVVKQTLKDAHKGKDMSVYSSYVRRMQFFSKYFPHKMIMKMWVKSVKKYIE